jgi:hypothetical protein
VHRLAYNGDVAAGQLAVFQGGPSRTGGKVPISGLIRIERATRKNNQLAAAHFERNDITIICETVH